VLDLATSPRKVTVDTGIVSADIGKLDGRWGIITVKKVASDSLWSVVNFAGRAAQQVFSDVLSIGQPVTGCYVNDLYTAAGYRKSKAAVMFTEYSAPTPAVVPLPLTTVSVKCGMPEEGTSSVFYLNQNVRKKTLNIVGIRNGKNVVSSQRLDPKLKGVIFGMVPRKAGDSPTVAILARLGSKQALQILDRTNKWRSVALPKVVAGSSVTGLVGVRFAEQSYLILQVTSRAKVTSYVRVAVPAKHL
jgi:hypothetical protein